MRVGHAYRVLSLCPDMPCWRLQLRQATEGFIDRVAGPVDLRFDATHATRSNTTSFVRAAKGFKHTPPATRRLRLPALEAAFQGAYRAREDFCASMKNRPLYQRARQRTTAYHICSAGRTSLYGPRHYRRFTSTAALFAMWWLSICM